MTKTIPIKLNVLVIILFLFTLKISAQDFKNAQEALSALDTMGECKCDTDIRAYRYFSNHREESIPVLISFTSNNRQRHFVGIRALSKLKDERVIKFFIDLANEELYKKTNYANGQFYDSESLISDLINNLGNYGDKRAIPVIKESLNRLNDSHREIDEEALCKLGAITIDELFKRRLNSPDEMMKIASQNRYANPGFALKVYDWTIGKFPENREFEYQAYLGKAVAGYNLENYKLVLKELQSIKDKFPERLPETSFSIEHRGYRYHEFFQLINDKIAKNK